MYRQCTTDKTTTQQETFQGALLHALQEHPYSNISITDLCAQTGLSRNIFYRLFDCKDDVLYSLLDQYFYACSHALHLSNKKEALSAIFSFWKKNRIILDILDKNQLGPLLSTRGTLCCQNPDFEITKLIKKEYQCYQVEILSFYTSAFAGLLFQWYHSGFARSVEEMADICYQMLSLPPIRID